MQTELFPDRRVVMLSLKPKFAQMILSGEKKIEFRKVYPNVSTRVFMYITEKEKSVTFALDLAPPTTDINIVKEVGGYGSLDFIEGRKPGRMALVIEKIWKVDNPVKLEELRSFGVTAPQGYIYLDKHPKLLARLSENLSEVIL